MTSTESVATLNLLSPEDVADVLQKQALDRANQPAFTFYDGEEAGESMTFCQLNSHVLKLSRHLQVLAEPGSRAILAYSAGLEFVVAFFACIRVGLIAVPVHSSRKSENFKRMEGIADDCGATLFLSSQEGLNRLGPSLAASSVLSGCRLVATDVLRGTESNQSDAPLARSIQKVAFLQYTSGSTGSPKGVRVTHTSVLANLKAINERFEVSADTIHVSWLPAYHDMGLIGSILSPVFAGCHSYLMAPQTFLARPLQWLEAISRLRATVAGAPNFAYDLCTSKAEKAGIEGLDLSSWRVAYTGGEPVRASTLQAFSRAFLPAGFRDTAFLPCYGMAETTLLVTGATSNQPRVLLRHGGSELVGCGPAISGHEVLIVDEASGEICAEGQLGEVWVRGPSVADGYWTELGEDQQRFAGITRDGRGPYLRTGDLAILEGGQLFPASRSKDMLIFNGENFFPQDIERTIEDAAQEVNRGGACAFSSTVDDRECLVLVVELARSSALIDDAPENPLFSLLASAIRKVHGLEIHEIVVLRVGSLPRTSSGKVRRKATRDALLSSSLRTRARWSNPYRSGEPVARTLSAVGTCAPPTSADEVEGWMIEWLAENLGLDYSAIETQRSFATFRGMDSLVAVELAAALGERFGLVVNATTAWDYPTIEALSNYLYRSSLLCKEAGLAPRVGEPTEMHHRSEANHSAPTDLDAIMAACEGLTSAEIETLLTEMDRESDGVCP